MLNEQLTEAFASLKKDLEDTGAVSPAGKAAITVLENHFYAMKAQYDVALECRQLLEQIRDELKFGEIIAQLMKLYHK